MLLTDVIDSKLANAFNEILLGEAARRVTPDAYFGAPNDPELWRHFDETARIMADALKGPR